MKTILNNYQVLIAEIEQLEQQIDRLQMLAQSPRVSNLTGMPRAGRTTDGMDIVAKIEDLQTQYYAKIGELLEMQGEIEALMAKLDNEERVAIRYKYMDRLKNYEIADKMKYSESTIKRRIWAAMEKMGG